MARYIRSDSYMAFREDLNIIESLAEVLQECRLEDAPLA
jgi:hypothetical protein